MGGGHGTADLFHFVAGFAKKQRPCFGLVKHSGFVLGVVVRGGGLFGKDHDCFDRTPQQQDAERERERKERKERKGEEGRGRERKGEEGREFKREFERRGKSRVVVDVRC